MQRFRCLLPMRPTSWTPLRTLSTDTGANTGADTASASSSFYAPGFAPPANSRTTPKAEHKRRHLATSLPSHLPSSTNKGTTTINSPQKKYREALRSKRHDYAQELLKKQGQKDAAAATQQAHHATRAREAREALAKVHSETQAHEAQVLSMLSLNTLQSEERMTQRSEQRLLNRKTHEEKQDAERRAGLAQLYASVDSFVTMENLDARVDQAVKNRRMLPYVGSLNELLQSPLVERSEIEARKLKLQEVVGL
ncbi:hypothetical protein BDF14DRAFT_1757878 [Spinellus fusiger]|nr:hypothetical protein BDF14DRAFT_1757878 [Spinellus fusiger]